MDGAFHSESFVSEFPKSIFLFLRFSIGFKNYWVHFVDWMKISAATWALLVFFKAALKSKTKSIYVFGRTEFGLFLRTTK